MQSLSSAPLPARVLPDLAPDADPAITLLGPSKAMEHLWTQVRRLAPHVRTLLLTGSPHSGQEAVARLLLDLSPFPRRGFLALRPAEAEEHLLRPLASAALPADLLLFLPDVHRFSGAAQSSLLRLLRGRRAGTLTIVAATDEDLGVAVALGRFSEELAEALGSVQLDVPALRDRTEDLPMLFTQLLAAGSGTAGRPSPQTDEDFLKAAAEHSWPGNLRELGRVTEHLVRQMGDGTELTRSDLGAALAAVQQASGGEPLPLRMIKLDTVVQEHICAVLNGCRGNKLRAAEVLGISRSTLYRMLETAAAPSSLRLAS